MIKDMMVSLVHDFREECRKNWYMKWLCLITFLVVIGGGSWKLYKSHVISKECKAQVAFSHALDEYHILVYSGALENDSRWEDAATNFKMVAQKHADTVYGNFAQAFLSDVELHKGSVQESITLLEQWIAKNSEKNPLYYLYKTRLALLYFDNNSKDEALNLLQELSVIPKNRYQDMAQFFLGYYYWAHDDIVHAQEVWQSLVDAQKEVSSEGRSPWASIAESKLSYAPSVK